MNSKRKRIYKKKRVTECFMLPSVEFGEFNKNDLKNFCVNKRKKNANALLFDGKTNLNIKH